jgi:hypothetical protein
VIPRVLLFLLGIIVFASTAFAAVPVFEIDMDPSMPGIQDNIDVTSGNTITTDVVITLPDSSASLSSFGFSLRWDNTELATPVLSNAVTYPLESGWTDIQCWKVDAANSLIVNCSQINLSGHAEGPLSGVVATITWTAGTPLNDSLPDIEVGLFDALDIAYNGDGSGVSPTFLSGRVDPGLKPVRISRAVSIYSDSLQYVYNNAITNETIQSQGEFITENIVFGSNILVKIEAGYNGDYSSNVGTTTITGNMLISDGTVIVQSGTLELQ